MPGIVSVLDETQDSQVPGDNLKLWLPSEISADDRDAWCLPDIPTLEFRFRFAQADDSLAELRRLRRLVQGLRDQNAKHLSTTQQNVTRSQGLFEGFKTRIRRSAKRYSHAHDALLLLDPDERLVPGWTHTGGEGSLTQWVHCEFIVSFEAIRPVITHQVCGEFF